MALLERTELLAELDEQLGAVVTGEGRLVLVSGEAGVGKTALVDAWADSARSTATILRGACDGSATPQPLGPFVHALPELAALPARRDRAALLAATTAALRPSGGVPVVLLVEDAHWADEASLDLLRALAVRLADIGALLLVTYRSDEVGAGHQLATVIGDLAGRPTVRPIEVRPLSLDAVRALVAEAETDGLDAVELYRRTGGNAFHVTECIASGGRELPGSVRDAVRARVARLDEATRAALDVVALAGRRAELEIVADVLGDDAADVDEAVSRGVLLASDTELIFRHDLARRTVAADIPPMRSIALHRAILHSLLARPGLGDPARIAHHAEAAREPAVALSAALDAAASSSELGAHREAALQFERALRVCPRDDERLLDLIEALSYEYYLTGRMDDAVTMRARALAIHEARDDRMGIVASHRWLSRLHWFGANGAAASAHGQRAVELVRSDQDDAQAAMALSNMAQLRMLAGDLEGTREWGERALAKARASGAIDVEVHALNNIGTAETAAGSPEIGNPLLVQSLELAIAGNLHEHAARAYSNLVSTSVGAYRFADAERYARPGIEFCADNDLDAWRLYLEGHLAMLVLHQGRFAEARAMAERILTEPAVPAVNRVNPLLVLGLAQARTGDGDAADALDEALRIAERSGELQRLEGAACARAELAWLRGEKVPDALRTAYDLALSPMSPLRLGEIASWLTKAGLLADPPTGVRGPFALEIVGHWRAAAKLWGKLGCPYAQALALGQSADVDDVTASVRLLADLGAGPAAARVGRRLASMGGRVPRQRRAATREHPAGLTEREAEVLDLLVSGATNNELADALTISPRTVEHHVSALLGKLGVTTRRDAVSLARGRGWVHLGDPARQDR